MSSTCSQIFYRNKDFLDELLYEDELESPDLILLLHDSPTNNNSDILCQGEKSMDSVNLSPLSENYMDEEQRNSDIESLTLECSKTDIESSKCSSISPEKVQHRQLFKNELKNELEEVTSTRKKQVAEAAKKHRIRRKKELGYLRKRVSILEDELEKLKREQANKRQRSSPWEAEARAQSMKREDAERENKLLKHSLEFQIEFAKNLQTVLNSHAKCSMFQRSLLKDDGMQKSREERFSLVEEPVTRRQQMMEILNKQFDELYHRLLEVGLYDTDKTTKSAQIYSIPEEEDSLEVEIVRCKESKGVDYSRIADSAWSAMTGKVFKGIGDSLLISTLEVVDEDTYYMKYDSNALVKCGGSPITFRTMFKRFRQSPYRECIVWKSVLDDKKYPGGLIGDDMGWLVISKKDSEHEDDVSSMVKLIVKTRPPAEKLLSLPIGMFTEVMMNAICINTEKFDQIIEYLCASDSSSYASVFDGILLYDTKIENKIADISIN